MAYRPGVVAILMLAGIAKAQLNGPNLNETNRGTERVLYFSGEVRLDDASPPPEPVAINRVCNGLSHFETWTDARGRFSFQASPGRSGEQQSDASQNTEPPADVMRPIGLIDRVLDAGDRGVARLRRGGCAGRLSIGPGEYRREEPIRRWPPRRHHAASALPCQRLDCERDHAGRPANARKAYDKGIDALANKRWKAAEDNLTKAVTEYPKFAIAWYQLGLLRQKRNDATGASDAWKQALASDPKYIRPYESLTALADHNGDWAASEAFSRAWIELDAEDFPAAYLYNAVANARLNHLEAAESAARQGLRIDKEHRIPRLDVVLAMLLMAKDKNEEAAGYLRQYLELAPKANDAAAVRQQLSRLDAAASARPQ